MVTLILFLLRLIVMALRNMFVYFISLYRSRQNTPLVPVVFNVSPQPAQTHQETTALRWKCNYKMAAAVLPHPCVSLILSCFNQHQLLLIYSLGVTSTTPPLERNIYEPNTRLMPGLIRIVLLFKEM